MVLWQATHERSRHLGKRKLVAGAAIRAERLILWETGPGFHMLTNVVAVLSTMSRILSMSRIIYGRSADEALYEQIRRDRHQQTQHKVPTNPMYASGASTKRGGRKPSGDPRTSI